MSDPSRLLERPSWFSRSLRQAGIVDSERQGLWAYYYVLPGALTEFSRWISEEGSG